MRVFLLTLLLTVLTSFTTVTVASPIEAKGLVIETALDFQIHYSFESLSKVTITDSLKIEPRWLGNINSYLEIDEILHIDPGQLNKGTINNYLIHSNSPIKILHIDPGQLNKGTINNYLIHSNNPIKILHVDPGRKN